MILYDRAIAFVGFNNQPFAFAHFSITYFSFADNAGKPGTTYNTWFKSCKLQDIKNHGRSGAFTGSPANRNCFFTFSNQRQHFRAFQNGNV